jgi:hypothetical protein
MPDLGFADRLGLGLSFALALVSRFRLGNLWINKRREREILPVDITFGWASQVLG